MHWHVLRLIFLVSLIAPVAEPSTVLVLRFHNSSRYPDLNWVGEGVAYTLMNEFAGANEIVLSRAARAETMKRLSLRPNAEYTKATLIRIAQTADADYLCAGDFEISMPPGETELKNSSIRISAQFIDMRKMHDGPELSEAGKLSELWRLEEHLAYQSLKYLEPHGTFSVDQFLSPQKAVRLDAQESYVRGLLSANRDQKQKWFLQAAALDNKFSGPAFELGRIALDQKQYPSALDWLRRVGGTDPTYIEARFKMGLAAYGAGDFRSAAGYFQEVAKTYPLSEVYNNLGAAENQLSQPSAADDLRRALESDPKNTVYLFNLGIALMKRNSYDEAAKCFEQVVDNEPGDSEAQSLLEQARRRDPGSVTMKMPSQRLKTTFNETAFRQLKAMVQSKGGGL